MTVLAPAGAPRGARAVEVAAQAKVNLRLRILARESSGYHQLETLFLRLELADAIRIRRTPGARSLDVVGPMDAKRLGPVERNLAWRAATAYFETSRMTGGFAIELGKQIPIGGGLGGGSADAGAVLRALEAMNPVSLGWHALADLAERLGADVPFLTCESVYALAWGRGERMLALAAPPERAVALVVPPFVVSTAEAFGWVAGHDAGGGGGREHGAPFTAEALGDWDGIAAVACNDFEPVVANRYPVIADHVAALRTAGCHVAMLSGSGSTVFGIEGVGGVVEAAIRALPVQGDGTRYIHTRTAVRVEPVVVIE
ncbi:4-(cytidine 5'-diphospho)-2-C-methyl-D-erythritol kinase [soil metagenome]